MYTQAFKEAVAYCKANNLFVGYGNPNGKVLVIGKEAAHIPQEETTENLEKKKEELFQSNVSQWEHILSPMNFLTMMESALTLTIPYMLTAINIIVGIKAKKEELVVPI